MRIDRVAESWKNRRPREFRLLKAITDEKVNREAWKRAEAVVSELFRTSPARFGEIVADVLYTDRLIAIDEGRLNV